MFTSGSPVETIETIRITSLEFLVEPPPLFFHDLEQILSKTLKKNLVFHFFEQGGGYDKELVIGFVDLISENS